jgi:two-component system LytT family response regulator
MTYRTIIVDDEPLARERLRTLLSSDPEIEIVQECTNGQEAIESVARLTPDLLFLDVQMPEVDGFAVLEAIGVEAVPAVIFVTAYDQYALKAFDVHAIDYLLKPFDRERFERALARAKHHLSREKSGELEQRLAAFMRELQGARYADRLVIKGSGRVFFLRVEEIDWVEAEGNYLRLHAGTESHLIRETMHSLESRLDPGRFMRIHRSHMVNVDRVKELKPWFRGEYIVTLRDGRELTLSRGYRDRLENFIQRQTG